MTISKVLVCATATLAAVFLVACEQERRGENPLNAASKGSSASNDVNTSIQHSRAVEAVIWGMPAVNYDLMLQEMLNKTPAKENEIIYWSKPVDWKNQTLTPNPDAIYLMTFFNTKDGPIVIEVPPADKGSFAANIDTVWQMPLEDAGPNGADKGAGGKYLILPPGYKEKARRDMSCSSPIPSGGMRCFDRTSQATLRRTSQSPWNTENG
jgi:hypothetical protein